MSTDAPPAACFICVRSPTIVRSQPQYDRFRRGLPPSTEEVEKHLDLISQWMDTAFRIPGLNWRFGLDPILGLVPFVGDALSSMVSLYILTLASRQGVSRITLARMGLNIGIDWVLGSLPIVGDVFDVWWKANRRNVQLLQGRLGVTGREARRATLGDWLFVALIIVALLVLLAGTFWFAWWILSLIFDPLWHKLRAR